MKKINLVKATNNDVVLKAVLVKEEPKEKKTKSGIILMNNDEPKGTNVSTENGSKIKVDHFEVLDIGPDVDKEKIGYKIGDSVIADNYDCQTIGDEDNTYIICKAISVKCVMTFK